MSKESNIFLERERLLKVGFIRKADIQRFFPCGHQKAKKLFDEIEKKINDSGKTISMFGIRTCDFLEYIGMTEKEILRDADLERKNNPTLDQK